MSPLGTYSFLPWLRQGMANQIASPDFDNTVRVRAHIDVRVEGRGDKVDGGTDAVSVDHPVRTSNSTMRTSSGGTLPPRPMQKRGFAPGSR